MAWIEPVTDRTDGSARMTYVDMNRIVGNINYIRELARTSGRTVPGSDISKTSWIRDDIITVAQWAEILDALITVANAVGYSYETEPDASMYYININNIENMTFAVYTILMSSSDNERLNHYIGDRFGSLYRYAGDPFNAGGEYN